MASSVVNLMRSGIISELTQIHTSMELKKYIDRRWEDFLLFGDTPVQGLIQALSEALITSNIMRNLIETYLDLEEKHLLNE